VTTPRWPVRPLGDFADFRNGINYNQSNFGSGMPVVGVKDFQNYTKPRYEELDEINPDGVVTEQSLLRDGDILFVRSNGNRELIGRSLYIESPLRATTHSAFTIRLRFREDGVVARFYAYLFRTSLIRSALSSQGGGTNISNLNQDILNNLAVPCPPRPTQERIAAVLSAYDDLIDNNRQRISILDEMARSLYREWFVNFRFPAHEDTSRVKSGIAMIPAGWELKRLGDVAREIRDGVAKGRLACEQPSVGLEHIPRRSLALDSWEVTSTVGSNKLRFRRGDVLFGKIRPYFHKVSLAPFEGVCSADTIVIRPKDADLHAVITACVSSDAFVAHASATSNGSKMPRADWKVLRNYPVLIPTTTINSRFASFFASAAKEQQTLVFANQNLRQTRDFLLPRLLSGQLKLEDVEPAA
jgi:type I restriction enzyme S subunit